MTRMNSTTSITNGPRGALPHEPHGGPNPQAQSGNPRHHCQCQSKLKPPHTYSMTWIRISGFPSIQHPKSFRYARRRRSRSNVQIPPSTAATFGSGTTVMVTKRFAPVVSLPKLEPALMSSLLEHPFVGPEIDFKSIYKDVRIVREEFAIPCSRRIAPSRMTPAGQQKRS